MRTYLSLLAPFMLFLGHLKCQVLSVGDPAPPLAIAKWVKGTPVDRFTAGNEFALVFWANWSRHCHDCIPELSRIQTKYREDGLTVISVASRDPNNGLKSVETMVAALGDQISYSVAWDVDRKTNNAYMAAAGRNSIPCAFVVDKTGKLAYIGHPMWLDWVLDRLRRGMWDATAGMREVAAAENQVSMLFQGRPEKAEDRVAQEELLVASYPFLAPSLALVRFNDGLAAKQFDCAYSGATCLIDSAIRNHDAETLDSIAWRIVDPEAPLERRDLQLALRAAEKAVEFSGSKQGHMLTTLARVHRWNGDLHKAIETQRRAMEVEGNESSRKALTEYEQEEARGK